MSDDFDKDLPPWLDDDNSDDEPDHSEDDFERDMLERLGGSGETPDVSFDDDSADDEEPADEEIPDWMRQAGIDESTAFEDDSTPDEVPDWMQTGSLDEALEAGDTDEDGVPDWMQTGAFEDAAGETGAERLDEQRQRDLPEWIQTSDLDLDAGEAGEEEALAADGEVPDWMQAAGVDESAAAEDVPEDEEAPAWMQTGSLEETPEAGDVGQAEVPDWVQADLSEETVDTPEPDRAEEPEAPGEAGLPDWMRDSEFEEAYEEVGGDEFVAEEDITGEEVPDWLQDESRPFSGRTGITDELESGAVPEWLQDAEEPPAEEEVPEGPDLESLLEEQPPDFDDMFGEADFDFDEPEEEEDFDLLGEMAADEKFDELLGEDSGEDDFDLFGELAGAEEGDEDDFDLLGELADEEAGEEPAAESEGYVFAVLDSLDEEAGETAPPQAPPQREVEEAYEAADEDLDALFAEDETGEAAAALDEDFLAALEAGEEGDVDFEALFGEEAETDLEEAAPPQMEVEEAYEAADEDLAALFAEDAEGEEAEPVAGDEGAFDWFADEEAAEPEPAATEEDLAWLEDLDEIDDLASAKTGAVRPEGMPSADEYFAEMDGEEAGEEVEPPEPEEEVDVDSFLASLGQGALAVRDTDQLDTLSIDTDFDADLLDEALAEFEQEEEEEKPRLPTELSPDAPEWLADLSVSVGDYSASAVLRQQQDRPVDELPDRLRALQERGRELPTEEETPSDTLESVLPGVRDTLPAAVFDTSATGAAAAAAGLTRGQIERVGILQDLVGRSVADVEAEEVAPPVRRVRPRVQVDRIAIAFLLAALMVLPFFIDSLNFGSLPPVRFEEETRQQSFFDQVDSLRPGQLLLIAAEYGPTGAAELDDSTEALLLHSLLRGARPVIVGGNPVGLLHVQNLAQEIADANDLTINEDYYVGRYLVGEAVGLRDFSANLERIAETDLRGEATGLDVDSLNQFALIVVITERADRLQTWAEQVVPLTSSPLLAVTGFGATPLSEPYVDAANADTLTGMLVGYRDAYTYRGLVDILLGGGELPTEPPPTEVQPTEIPATETPPPTEAPATATEQPAAEETEEAVVPAATDTPQPTSTPTVQPSPTETSAPATDTPVPTATSAPTSTPEPVTYGFVISDQRVNVRGGPSTSDPVVSSVGPDDRVLVIGENADGSWYNVILNDGTEGWIADFLLRIEVVEPEAAPEPSPTPQGADAGHKKIRPLVKRLPQIEQADETEAGERVIVAPADERDEYRDERWYSMTIGIIVSVIVITLGTLFNVVRVVFRARR